MICRNCNGQIRDGSAFCTICGAPQATQTSQATQAPQTPPPAVNAGQGMNFDFNTNTASPVSAKYYQYKVLSQKDKWFTGKFDPMVLEQALNAYAQQGWRVIGCATADIPSFGTARQEFITILEREV